MILYPTSLLYLLTHTYTLSEFSGTCVLEYYMSLATHSLNVLTLIRWSGSDTNPQDNAGQGKAGTDRSNMVLLTPPNYDEGDETAGPSNGHWGNSYPAKLDSNQTLLGWSRADRQSLAVLDTGKYICTPHYMYRTQTHGI